jgi:hypothetical protein
MKSPVRVVECDMIIRQYHVVFDANADDWELRQLDAASAAAPLAHFPTQQAAVDGCKRHCRESRRFGWVAAVLAFDRQGRLAFEQLFEPGVLA